LKVSTKGRYGLRIMTELASKYGEGSVLAETIAGDQEISVKYIHNIVSALKSAGLVRVARGRNGGYELARAPSQITALNVVNVLEGQISPSDCVLKKESCTRAGTCATRDIWVELGDAMTRVLGGVTLEQLAEKQKRRSNEPSSYTI